MENVVLLIQLQEKNYCALSSVENAPITCTKCYDIIETEKIGKKLIFIDTPGLKDAKGDENDIKEVAKAIAEHLNFRAFLI